MKKITFIFALLCASVMGWAGSTPYCNVTSPNANFTFSLMNVSGNLYRIQFDAVGDDKFASTPYNNNCGVNQTEGAGITFGNDGWVMTDDRAYKDFTTATSTSVPTSFYGNYFCFNKKGGGLIEITGFDPSDVDWTATCGSSCSDTQAPTVSAVSVTDVTYKSAVLTITASDNTTVTRYVVKNGELQIGQGTTNVITLSNLASGTTYSNIKVYAYDACNNESDAFSVAEFTTETITYCRFATGHLGQAEFGDIYGRILVTIKKVDNSTIGVKVEPNNNGTKGIKYLNIIVNNVGHEYGNNDGSGDDLTGYFNISGLSSLNFNININFYCNTPNWTTNQFSVEENQLCDESPVVLSEGSEYCGDYGVECDRHNGAYAYLKWETTEDGDVVITMIDGTGSTNARFRGNNGMGENLNGFTVLSGTGFATSEAASKYFTRVYVANGNTFKLQRKGGAVLPSPAKIRFTSPALEWYCTQDGDGYAWPTYEYTYAKTCAVVSGYAVSAYANDAAMGTVTAKVDDEDVTHVDAGTTVRFTATANDTYTFINWTKGGVALSTNPVYDLEINEATALVANFDYIRNTYCHTAVTSDGGKKFYLTLGSIGGGQYQIKYEGSSDAKITGINDANFQINGVSTSWDDDGQDVPFSKANGAWTFDDSGYGSVYTTFELAAGKTWKDIYAWTHYMYFACEGMGQQTLTDVFPNRYRIAWDETCADATAPLLAAPAAVALNTTDVRLTLSATDNWGGIITYNINYKPTGAEGEGTNVQVVGASGAQITKDIEGLTTNTEYTFTITASDGSNVSAAQTCKATPAGDVNPPTSVNIVATPLSTSIVRLTLSADDDYAGDITYNIAYDNAGAASTSAAQGTTTTLEITGLTADTEYHFSVVATDAAGNAAAAVNASAVRTYAENLALNKPCTAGHETGNAGEVKEKSNDGDKASRWSSYGSINKGTLDTEDWWAVKLDGVYDIHNLRLSWQDARSDNMNVYVSMDGEHWNLVQNFDFMPESSADGNTYTNYELTGATGRYVKVLSLHDYFNGQWGISFWELEAYGTLATDVTAPVISSFTADGASTSSVLLKATATDNFNGDLTYTFYCNDVAQGEPIVKASGVEATYTVTGLTMGTDYNFKVNVSDGVNNTMSDVVVGSPISDNAAPENVTVSTKSKSDEQIILTLSATDNLAGMIYYTVTCGETVKYAEALSGEEVDVTFDGLDYNTPYTFSVVAKDGSDNAADAVAHNETTKPASYPTVYAPASAFAETSVRPVFSSAYSADCNFPNWGGSAMERETYGVKKATYESNYLGIDGFGTIKLDADDELYLSVWTNEDIQFRVVPIIHNAEETGNLPERGAFTEMLTGGQWNVIRFTMSDFVLNDDDAVVEPNVNYDRIYQIKIDRAGNQTFWLDNIYFRRKGAIDENANNTEFLTANNNEGQDVTVARSFTAGSLYTLVLPFDVDAAQTAAKLPGTLTKLNNSYIKENGDLRINFVNVAAIEAGVPYLYEPSADVANPVFEGVTVSKDLNPTEPVDELAKYYGIYATMDGETLKAIPNAYVLGSDQYLYDVQDLPNDQTMKALRGYFVLNFPNNTPNGAPKPRAKVVFNSHETNTATGIEAVSEGAQCTKYIDNGMLYIIRDGKTYNVQGQLVK